MNMLKELGYTKESLPEIVKKLNWTYNQEIEWIQSDTKREYDDSFGQRINSGDIYYRLRLGFTDDLILSEVSMERYLYIKFITQPGWDKEAEKKIRKETDKAREIIDNIRRGEIDK